MNIEFTNGSIIHILESCQNTRGYRSEIITYYKPIVANTKLGKVVIRKEV